MYLIHKDKRLADAVTAAVHGAVATCKGKPLCSVADTEYEARTLQGDAYEYGWQQVANDIDFHAAQSGKCPGLGQQE